MNIRIQREFQIDADAATVRGRLGKWSDKYGFVCTQDQELELEYRRGSHLAAGFSFDIRKVPTVARIRLSDSKPRTVDCVIHVKSPLSFATPGDPRRVEEQVELLMAYVKGLVD